MSETVLVISAGHAAGQLVSTLRHKGYDGRIVVAGEEPWVPYQRPPLSKKYLSGELERNPDALEAHGVLGRVLLETGQPEVAKGYAELLAALERRSAVEAREDLA